MDRFSEIKVTPPTPDACPVCACKHDPSDPHVLESIYYQNRFRKEHKRFPNIDDASAHCSEMTKAYWRLIYGPTDR